MAGPIWKLALNVFTSPQTVEGRPVAAGLDPDGVPCVWYVADVVDRLIETTPTGAPSPEADHLSSFVWGGLMLHVWVHAA